MALSITLRDGDYKVLFANLSAFVLAEDPARQRVIVYGGKTDCGTASDLWSLDLRSLTWTSLRGTIDGLACGRTGRENCRSLCQ